MQITKLEFGALAKWLFKQGDDGKATPQKVEEFIAWGHKAMDTFSDNTH